jgi:ligand-binding SRPBCC domain-containing protein
LTNKYTGIRMERKNGLFTVKTQLFLPRPLREVFPFFADAGNLERITPPWLHFKILTPRPIVMREGTIIDYQLRIRGFRVHWQSEITGWEPPHRFVDVQRRGPYRKWIHEHTFTDCGDGSEIRDYVQYAPPGGWLANFLFVQRDIRKIFNYRTQELRAIFIVKNNSIIRG